MKKIFGVTVAIMACAGFAGCSSVQKISDGQSSGSSILSRKLASNEELVTAGFKRAAYGAIRVIQNNQEALHFEYDLVRLRQLIDQVPIRVLATGLGMSDAIPEPILRFQNGLTVPASRLPGVYQVAGENPRFDLKRYLDSIGTLGDRGHSIYLDPRTNQKLADLMESGDFRNDLTSNDINLSGVTPDLVTSAFAVLLYIRYMDQTNNKSSSGRLFYEFMRAAAAHAR